MSGDVIRIKSLKVFAHHGVFEDEKQKGQNFYINANLYSDLAKAGRKDDYDLATSYAEVCETIIRSVTEVNYNLIEAVAEHVAEAILHEYPLVTGVDIEVSKPEAPIKATFHSVSVEIHREWKDAYIAFGSNMGDREGYIEDALDAIANHHLIELKEVSTKIETKPYGGVKQDDFLNGVCHIRTIMSAEELLKYLAKLELISGRERYVHWGPRTLDLDIILFGDEIISTKDLCVPHIDMANRDFVLEPMCEIAPFARHPITHKTMSDMLAELKSRQTNR